MTDNLKLPEFKIPRLKKKSMTMQDFDRVILQNYRLLAETGRLKTLLEKPGRRPVDERFRLKRGK